MAYCAAWEHRKESLDYEIDGVVVKVNDLDMQRELGFVGREPRWAVAYKFPPTQATTKLIQIGMNVGRTGSINPFAILEPVRLAGVTIKLATLHNEEDIARKDIREGDTVLLHRAGEVIPQVIGPILSKRPEDAAPWQPPEHCPVCGTPLVKPEGEAMRRCPNTLGCPAQRYELLKHFVSRSAMDIQGIGESLAQALLKADLVHDVADLYYLKQDQLLSLDRMGEKSAENVLKAIEGSKERPLPRLVFALGYPARRRGDGQAAGERLQEPGQADGRHVRGGSSGRGDRPQDRPSRCRLFRRRAEPRRNRETAPGRAGFRGDS